MVDLLIAALGAIVTVTGAAWWVKERQSASRRLYRALLNPDPAGRAREVRSLAGRPLAQFARSLLEAARRETEPSVLTAIGELVASHSWEPADGIDVAELRKTIYERLSAKEGRSQSQLEGTGSAGVLPEHQRRLAPKQRHLRRRACGTWRLRSCPPRSLRLPAKRL